MIGIITKNDRTGNGVKESVAVIDKVVVTVTSPSTLLSTIVTQAVCIAMLDEVSTASTVKL